MKKVLILLLLITGSFSVFAKNKKVRFSCSEPDSKIFVEGKLVGTGQVDIVVPSYSCLTVRVEKTGFLIGKIEFCNKPGFAPPPKIYQYTMEKDDAYDASTATDIGNVDIEVKTKKNPTEAWSLLSQIITGYFDAIETTDKETGYLRTAWVVKSFKQSLIRTRLVVKSGNSSKESTSLGVTAYKIKLISEVSTVPNASVKNDEQFKEWDRILRKYKDVISEIQSRLGS
jgi:hypothetical protein